MDHICIAGVISNFVLNNIKRINNLNSDAIEWVRITI